jgi:hypothetical protein
MKGIDRPCVAGDMLFVTPGRAAQAQVPGTEPRRNTDMVLVGRSSECAGQRLAGL